MIPESLLGLIRTRATRDESQQALMPPDENTGARSAAKGIQRSN